jgi:hypothetical protein
VGYRGKVVEQERARELRAQSWTLQEIATELGVARSSVSAWVRDVEFVAKPRRSARRRAPNALTRRKQTEIDGLHRWGREVIGTMGREAFLVAGAALYAGEGAKRDGCVKFANSDPQMIRLFCSWLREFFDIEEERLRVRLYLHEGLDLDAAMAFWAELTGIPQSQFTKPYRAVPDVGIRHNKHPMGCPSVAYSCSWTHRAVMGLVGALLSSKALPG